MTIRRKEDHIDRRDKYRDVAVKTERLLDELIKKGDLCKGDLPNIPVEGEITPERLKESLMELYEMLKECPEIAQGVLYLLGEVDSIEDIENTAFVDLAVIKRLGKLKPVGGITLNIVDAHVFNGMKEINTKVGKILDVMKGENTKVAVVIFSKDDEWVGKLAEEMDIVVVSHISEGDSPEEVVVNEAELKYQVTEFNSINVLSTINNLGRWRPGLNAMVRYVVCNNNVTICGILKLYDDLPYDIKQALAESGITVQFIQRSQVVDEDFRPEQFNENTVTEIAKAA